MTPERAASEIYEAVGSIIEQLELPEEGSIEGMPPALPEEVTRVLLVLASSIEEFIVWAREQEDGTWLATEIESGHSVSGATGVEAIQNYGRGRPA